MKKPNLKLTALALGIVAAISASYVQATDLTVQPGASLGQQNSTAAKPAHSGKSPVKPGLINEPPHKIYHVIKNKTLAEAANQIADRGRVVFNIDPALKSDIIDKKLAGDNWNEILAQLLDGYNYSTKTEKGVITMVWVTGHNGAGIVPNTQTSQASKPTDNNKALIVAPVISGKIPAQYKSYAPGSVFGVNLPMQALSRVALGDEVVLDLPIGQYTVMHDNLVDHGDGDTTWVGYLSDEGQGYRVYLSQGKTGVMGSIFTPDGEYTVATVKGSTVLLDLAKSGLEHAGFDGDVLDPMLVDAARINSAAQPVMAAGATTTTAVLAALKATLDYAVAALDTFEQKNPWITAYVDSSELVYKNQTAIADITASLKLHITQLATAKADLIKVPKTEPIPELSAKILDLQALIKTEQANLKVVVATYQDNVKAMNASIANYKKLSASAKAELKKALNTDDTSSLKSQIADLDNSVKEEQANLKSLVSAYQADQKAANLKIAGYTKEIASAQAALKKAPPTAISVELNSRITDLQQLIKTEQAALAKAVATNAADLKATTAIKSGLVKQYGKAAQDGFTVSSSLLNAVHAAQKAYDVELTKTIVTNTDPGTVTPPTTPTPPPVTTSGTDASVVELMVLYTTETQTPDFAKQRIQFLIDIANQAYKDSGINMMLKLVHTRPTMSAPSAAIKAVRENSNNSATLSTLATDADIKTLRAQYGADLVMLFKPLYANTSGSCGVAYLPPANSAGILNNSSYNGYSVVNDGTSKDSNKSYCDTTTFAHEVGHNLGNAHDREYSSSPGVFSYSYAWGIKNTFGTIMSYNRPTIALFSTPLLLTQCNGGPCGFPEGNAKSSDQTRTTNAVAPQVANYFASKQAAPTFNSFCLPWSTFIQQ